MTLQSATASSSRSHHCDEVLSDTSSVTRGLTLIEILIGISILGIIVVMFFIFLQPSKTQRCQMEGEKLSAYLAASSNESKMRGAPIQVKFLFNRRGEAHRQIAKKEVESTKVTWIDDPRAEVYKVKSPALLSEVETYDQGVMRVMKEGEPLIIFKGLFTAGGVAVLTVKDVICSVIVPPTQEPPFVKMGRHSLESLQKFKALTPLDLSKLNEVTTSDFNSGTKRSKSSRNKSSVSSGSSPSRRPPSRPPFNRDSNDPPTDDLQDEEEFEEETENMGEVEEEEGEGGEEEEPSCGDEIIDEDEECDDGDLNSDEEPDACRSDCTLAKCGDGVIDTDEQCDDGNQSSGDGCSKVCEEECMSDEDCKEGEWGAWGACTLEKTCGFKLPSLALESISSAEIVNGGVFNQFISDNLNQWATQQKLNIAVSVGQFNTTYNKIEELRSMQLFFNQRVGVNDIISDTNLPVYMYGVSCQSNQEVYSCEGRQNISLYVKHLGSRECAYQILSLSTTLSVTFYKNGSAHNIILKGTLSRRAALQFKLNAAQSLADLIQENSIDPSTSCGDGNVNAWEITIQASALEKTLQSEPWGSEPCPVDQQSMYLCDSPPSDEEIQSILNLYCTECHGDDRQDGNLNLSAPFRNKVVNQPSTTQTDSLLVTPKKPSQSLLYEFANEKISEPHSGTEQEKMRPFQLDMLESWILNLE